MILEVQNGCFGYPKQPVILENINLRLEEGLSLIHIFSLSMDFQNDIQGSGGNAQPLCHGNIVFNVLVNFVPADDQHMAPAQKRCV